LEEIPQENGPKTYFDDGDDDLFIIRKSKIENDAELKKRAKQKRQNLKAKAKSQSTTTTATTTATTTPATTTSTTTTQTNKEAVKTEAQATQQTQIQATQTQTQPMEIDQQSTQIPSSPTQILDHADSLIFENDELPQIEIFVENDENNENSNNINNSNNNDNNINNNKEGKNEHEIIVEGVEADEDDFDVEIEQGFILPKRIYDNLYEYQRTGVKWLWQLHTNYVGGYIDFNFILISFLI